MKRQTRSVLWIPTEAPCVFPGRKRFCLLLTVFLCGFVTTNCVVFRPLSWDPQMQNAHSVAPQVFCLNHGLQNSVQTSFCVGTVAFQPKQYLGWLVFHIPLRQEMWPQLSLESKLDVNVFPVTVLCLALSNKDLQPKWIPVPPFPEKAHSRVQKDILWWTIFFSLYVSVFPVSQSWVWCSVCQIPDHSGLQLASIIITRHYTLLIMATDNSLTNQPTSVLALAKRQFQPENLQTGFSPGVWCFPKWPWEVFCLEPSLQCEAVSLRPCSHRT